MSKVVIPTQQPVLPEYILDPDGKTSVDELKNAVVQWQMWVLLNDYAAEKKMDVQKFIKGLTNEEKVTLQDKATDAALTHADLISNLAERTTFRIAYEVLKRSIHRTQGEWDNFADYLEDKAEHTMSKTSKGEVTFLLELIQRSEIQGKKEYSSKVFCNRGAYGRLVESLPILRKKFYRAVAVEQNERKTIVALNEKKEQVKKEIKSTDDEEEREELYGQIRDINEQIDEVRAVAVEEKEKAQMDLTANTRAAFDVAGSATPRKEVKHSVELLAKKYLEDDGHDPEEISKDYGPSEEPKRPVAYTVNQKDAVIFVMTVKPQFGNLVTKLLETTFDVHMAELDEMLSMLETYQKGG